MKYCCDILSNKFIKMSESGSFGPGVYFTSLSPETGIKKLMANNFDGGKKVLENRRNHLQTFIAIRISINSEKLYRVQHDDRDIWIFKGNVDLTEFSYSWGFV